MVGAVVTARIALYVLMLGGAMYAATGLFSSLTEFGIGTAVVAFAWLAHGLLRYVHDQDITHTRESVWARRDGI